MPWTKRRIEKITPTRKNVEWKKVDRGEKLEEIKSRIYMYYRIKMTKCIKEQNVYNDKRYKMAKRLKWQNVLNDKTYEMTKHLNTNCIKLLNVRI
jgi:hypothetical protein